MRHLNIDVSLGWRRQDDVVCKCLDATAVGERLILLTDRKHGHGAGLLSQIRLRINLLDVALLRVCEEGVGPSDATLSFCCLLHREKTLVIFRFMVVRGLVKLRH